MAAKKKPDSTEKLLPSISGVARGGMKFTVDTILDFQYDDGRQGHRYKVDIGGDTVVVTTPLGLMEFAETL